MIMRAAYEVSRFPSERDPATPRWMEWLPFGTGTLATLGALGRLSILYRRPER
jgi:hypothetical protein